MAGKTEHVVVDLLLDILRRRSGEPVTDNDLARELPNVSIQLRMNAVNALLASKRIEVLRSSDGAMLYKEASEETSKLRGLNSEELLVYQVIKAATNKGVWTKDMKSKTNLAQPQITKVLKTLESRGLVKSVKSVANPSRKVYMLAGLEPSREVTGGAWYTENQFDSEFIQVLREACYEYIRRQGDPTVQDVSAFIRKKGFSKVDLRDEDIQTIIMTLVYDSRVEEVDGEGNDIESHYRATVMPLPDSTAFTAIPCGVCPVFNSCHEGGLISPQSCIYYEQWFKQLKEV